MSKYPHGHFTYRHNNRPRAKVKYKIKEARRAVKSLQAQTGLTFVVYKCRHCLFYHVGQKRVPYNWRDNLYTAFANMVAASMRGHVIPSLERLSGKAKAEGEQPY